MLFEGFKCLAIHLFTITLLLATTFLVIHLFQGEKHAIEFLTVTVSGMKAPWVWTFGWGLALFIQRQGMAVPISLNAILSSGTVMAMATARIENSIFHRKAVPYTTFTTAIGLPLTYLYGIPNSGLAYILIFLGILSIYYIAGYILYHFVEVSMSFHYILQMMDDVRFKTSYSPLHIENLTTYLALTTTIGLTAVYAGFRGTLTAGFTFPYDDLRPLLSTPLILFLPATLLYNYYPRYVLRKIAHYHIFMNLQNLSVGSKINARSLLLEVKEYVILSSQIIPFLDHKNIPSYFIAILFVFSLVYNYDPSVKNFFDFLTIEFQAP